MFESVCCRTVLWAAAIAVGHSPEHRTARVVHATETTRFRQTPCSTITLERKKVLSHSKNWPRFVESEV